jgi:hypothetical protein
MTATGPVPDDDAAVSLSQAEQDELNNRIVSGDADREDSAGNVELAQLGSYVLVEVDEDQQVEKHADEKAAGKRYEELKGDLVERDDE